MARTILVLLISALAALLAHSPAGAQQSYCLPPDDTAAALIAYAKRLATDPTLTAKRDRYGIKPVAEGDVEIVTSESVCEDAVTGYNRALNTTSPRQVHVVRVGKRYIVLDPNELVGEFQLHIVFSSKNFRKVNAQFAG